MNISALPLLIQQMLEPEFYPHPVTEPIALIQTHISFVLLTGDYVYKIKKPVNFGFVDFSTLDKRKHFCYEELRLNQRTAPDLYLEVLPIVQERDRVLFSPDAEEISVIEYAIKMRQFPQETLLINMFERGELTEKHLETLGKELAKIHRNAPTSDYIRKFGEVARIRDAMNNNYRQTEKYIGSVQTPQQYEETRGYTEQFFEHNQELFKQRIEKDKIRECHGDLHLKNVAFWQDKIVIFDCIEFNEPFRYVDFIYDVAFTVMDLESRSRKDLANAFLNTYLEHTGDWEGVQVLPLYLSRQAYVRAKVNSLMLDDSAISPEEKDQILPLASHYYTLAWEYTQPRQGKIILMSGLSGSGKSTIARYLSRKINAIHIRSDAVRKHIAGIDLYEKGSADVYTPEMTQKTYQRLGELGVMLAKQGFSVILDAKYDRLYLRENAINLAKENQLEIQIIYCNAPVEVLRERLQKRVGDITDAKVDLLASQLESAEPFSELEKDFVQEIDTNLGLEVQLQQFL